MYRVYNPTASAVLPAATPGGAEGYFTDGTPGVDDATIVDADFLNNIQEELIAAVVASGQAPDRNNRAQLLQAIRLLGGGAYAMIQDRKANTVAGGTFTAAAWRTRDLTTILTDPTGLAALNSNRITLQPGTYRVRAEAPGNSVGPNVARLQNITNATTLLTGTVEDSTTSGVADGVSTRSIVSGQFTLVAASQIELQHQGQATQATYGFGFPASMGVTEVYSTIELWKVS